MLLYAFLLCINKSISGKLISSLFFYYLLYCKNSILTTTPFPKATLCLSHFFFQMGIQFFKIVFAISVYAVGSTVIPLSFLHLFFNPFL
jgi:hypothetical protein